MSGFPGSGKSTLARLIAKHTGAIVIDHDIVKSALLESLEDNIDAKVAGKISYNIDWSLIDFHLSQGHDVIFDSPCLYPEMVEKGSSLSEKYNSKYKYVECYLNNFKEINNRLKIRERRVSQIQMVSSEDAFNEWVDKSIRPSKYNYFIVDSAQPIDSFIEDVIKYIND